MTETLSASQLSSTQLELEITEGILLERSGLVLSALDSLRQMGVRLAIDDFGTVSPFHLDPDLRLDTELFEGAGRGVPGLPARTGAVGCHGHLRMAPVRRLARKMADNGLLDPAVAAAIGRVTGVARHSTRLGNGLTKEQAHNLLNGPNPKTLAGKRDRVRTVTVRPESKPGSTNGQPRPASPKAASSGL